MVYAVFPCHHRDKHARNTLYLSGFVKRILFKQNQKNGFSRVKFELNAIWASMKITVFKYIVKVARFIGFMKKVKTESFIIPVVVVVLS